MEEDTIIQKDLFAINHEIKRPNNSSKIPEDLSTEELKNCLLYTSPSPRD